VGVPVGLEYYDYAPFKFNIKIEQTRVGYTKKKQFMKNVIEFP